MGILGRIFFALAGLCFVGAVIALVGFVAGGFDAIDGGAAGAVMAYVPVALACGLAGAIAYAAGDALRDKARSAK
jgi:hypothetical protein